MKIEVKEGSVHVNDIWVLAEHDDVVVLQADLKDKYADIFGYSDYEIMIYPANKSSDDYDITHIIIHDLDFEIEYLFGEISRYTLLITVVKSSEGRKVWSDENR